jgi:hypothetical protein
MKRTDGFEETSPEIYPTPAKEKGDLSQPNG